MIPRNGRFSPLAAVMALALAGAPFAVPGVARAVNLVPNASFENYANCPGTYGQFYECVGWSMPNAGTSDLFNACSPTGFPSVSVPTNTTGYQVPVTGVGYAGIIPYSPAPDYREYLQAPLTSPLAPGATYTVSFMVSLADTSSIAIDRLGAYFSVGPIGPLMSNTTLLVTPQVESPANVFLTNSTGWTTISGTFVAAGGEDHIIIGSFRDDASTNTVPGPSVWPGGAYYFIDDVATEFVPTNVDRACCLPDGSCTLLTSGECQALGGTPLAVGVPCSPDNPCGPTPTTRSTWGSVKGIYR